MRNPLLKLSAPVAALVAVAAILTGCAKSHLELLQDRSGVVERKLLSERDRVLSDAAGERDSRLSHLQTLRLGLSTVNVSIVSVPLLLRQEEERAIGYSVLDEALATIDWNIPIYGVRDATLLRPYPSLFSPQSGLDFSGIRRSKAPAGIGP